MAESNRSSGVVHQSTVLEAKMKDIGIITFLSVIVSAAAPTPPVHKPGVDFVTAKSTDAFASCFANTQDRGALPWWYAPKDHGGTFSNLGSRSMRSAYFVTVSDRGGAREIRLEGKGAAEAPVRRAVSECV